MFEKKGKTALTFTGLIVALGIIYGDIGTSPLYVFKAIIGSGLGIDRMHVLGAISCIIWTLTLQTTIKYVVIILRADNKGEGGIFSLFALLRKKKGSFYLIAILGGSTLLADGIITPSITVLSATEGLRQINSEVPVISIALIILSILFFIQQFGTQVIGKSFGPIMFVWFFMLGILGLLQTITAPVVLAAFNPWYAVQLISTHPKSLMLLGAVFLCTTGAEALYTDLGHCGIRNIRISWIFVKSMLVLTYLGQGAWVLNNIELANSGMNPFFGIMPQWFLVYGIVIATAAAIIASQALISGSFTLISEAISLNFWPKLKVKYPSSAKGQMYIPFINLTLFLSCIAAVVWFGSSEAMEAAYGLSITITMLMTTILMVKFMQIRNVKKGFIYTFAAVYFVLEGGFLFANLTKFFHGGYFTIIIASFLSFVMIMMYQGRKVRNRFITFEKIQKYLPVLSDLSKDTDVPKYASNLVYLTHADRKTDIEAKTIFSLLNRKPKRADVYWFLHVDILDEPFTAEYLVRELSPNVFRIDFYLGFKVQPKIDTFFKQVVKTMESENKIVTISPFKSLNKYDIATDFRFVHIDRRVSHGIDLPFFEKLTINFYFLLRSIGWSDVRAFGLDAGLVSVEKIPLTIPERSKIVVLTQRQN